MIAWASRYIRGKLHQRNVSMSEKNIVIIDYGAGNLRSAAKACERALADHSIAGKVQISNNPKDLAQASHIILPGVGAFGDCMQGLSAIDGMLDALEEHVIQKQTWFLGICVGMQLLFERGFEHGTHNGLGWIPGEVRKLTPSDTSLKVPHMGWNIISPPTKSTDFAMGHSKAGSGLAWPTDHALVPRKDTQGEDSSPSEPSAREAASHVRAAGEHGDIQYVYFVHSYHACDVPSEYVLATTNYGEDIVAMVGKDNIFGTQFHPEKSQAAGLALLANFMRL